MNAVSKIEPLVSVILPSLNVVNYIDECLNSVINQSIKEIEVIVVDAGSTDGTLEIVHRYAEKDSRVKVIDSDKKSYGYQLNLGMSVAKGEYIGIVETDDYIELDMYEKLLRVAREENADYVKGNAEMFLQRNGLVVTRSIISVNNGKQEKVIVNPSQTPHLWIDDAFLWTGIYKRTFVNKYHLRETKGAAFQDISFLYCIIGNGMKGVYVPEIFYHYRQDNAGASSYDDRSMDFVCSEYSYIKNELMFNSSEWQYIFYRRLAIHILNRINFMVYGGRYWDNARESIEWLQNEMRFALTEGVLTADSFESRDDWNDIRTFLENPRSIFELRLKSFRERQDTRRKIVKELDREEGWIVCGNRQEIERISRGLLLFGIKICAICDVNYNNDEENVYGYDVSCLDEAIKSFPYAFIMTSPQYTDNIQLSAHPDRVFNDIEKIFVLTNTDIRLFTSGL